AGQAFERGQLGHGPLVVSELAEAAARTRDVAAVRAALEWLSERTRVVPTEWALGIETRICALLSDGEAADSCYRRSIEHLGRTPVRAELARAHLLYGEWLRRQRRRRDARDQLRTAHQMLDAMGMAGFAERARREPRRPRHGGPPRAARHRRAGPSARPRGRGGAHPAGGADRPAGGRAPDQPGDRRPAVHQRQHRRIPPAEDLPQAWRRQSQPARPDAPHRQAGTRAAGLTGRYGLPWTRIRSSTWVTPGADHAAATA